MSYDQLSLHMSALLLSFMSLLGLLMLSSLVPLLGQPFFLVQSRSGQWHFGKFTLWSVSISVSYIISSLFFYSNIKPIVFRVAIVFFVAFFALDVCDCGASLHELLYRPLS